MARIQTPRDLSAFATGRSSSGSMLRRTLRSQVSGIALRSAIGLAAVAGASVAFPGAAWADCTVSGVSVLCTTTSTTNTVFGVNPPSDRHYIGAPATPVTLVVQTGATVSGNGLAVTNTSTGGVTVANDGAIVVDAGNTPTQGGTAALSLTTTGGPIVYTGSGSIANNGTGDAVNILNNGSGTVTVDISGASSSVGGSGVVVRDTTASGGDMSVTTGDVTALTGFSGGINVQTRSSTADITVVANGDIRAGRVGIAGEIVLGSSGTGNMDITANGSIDAETGVSAFNAGSGSTTVTTVGPVNATTGNGIFALNTGGALTVSAGDVTSTGNTAILVQQTSVGDTGAIDVTTGNVSGTTGIFALGNGSRGATSITTNGTVTGTSAEGILVIVGGAMTIAVADTVTGATHGLSLSGGANNDGDILVTGAGGFVGGTGNAANIQNNGSGTVTVDISGASSSADGHGIVVRDTARGGDISVTTGDVTALAGGMNGIDVQTQSLTGDITIVANGDIRAGNAGIQAQILPGAGTGNVNVTANGAIDGVIGIISHTLGTGSATVTAVGPINTTTGRGLSALTTGGTVTVNAGDVTTTGNTAIVAQQISAAGAGAVNVTAGNVSGTTGIFALNTGTGAVNVTTNGTVTGTLAEGLNVTGNGGVTVQVVDTVTGATSGLLLTGGSGGAGDISVTGAGGFVGGTGNAASIQNNGSGTVTVDISGASSSTAREGIVVRDTIMGGDITVTTGDVTALSDRSDGIDVQARSLTGDIAVVTNGGIRAGNAGIVAGIFPGGTGNVDVTANGLIDARFGIDSANFGTGSTTVTAVGPITTTTGNGIFAQTLGGAVTVMAENVTSTGNIAIVARQGNATGAGAVDVTAGDVSGTTGIFALNNGTGAVSVTTNGAIIGTAAEGISATGNGAVTLAVVDTVTGATSGLSLTGGTSGAGDISVTGAGGFVGGTVNAANIVNNGSGTVTIDISGASSSADGHGIVVRDTALGGDISVTTGDVTALTVAQDGIDVASLSLTGDVTIVANGDIRAGHAGIFGSIIPAMGTGDITITANGLIDARHGIDAQNYGSGAATVTAVGPVNVTGNGLFVQTSGGAATVNAGDVTSTGDIAVVAQQISAGGAGAVNVTARNVSGTTGVVALSFGTGQTQVTTTGNVIGSVDFGIRAQGGTVAGDITIDAMNVTGAVAGIATRNNGLGATDITVRGLVQGATNGIDVFSSGGQAVNIQNLGVIQNSSGQSSDLALNASGGAIEFTNTGALIGRINLSGTSSETQNFGSWTSIGGTSGFFGADDRLLNAGSGVIVGSGLAGLAETTVWAGLEAFSNGGQIRLQDGGTGDSIQTSANTQFLGGSVLSADIGGLNSDLFFTTGTVNILPGSVLTVNTAQPLVFGHQYVIVQADGGLTGQFDFADEFFTAFIGLRDGYTATSAFVEMAQIRALADAGLTPNQKAAAAGADSLADNDEVKGALLLLPDDAAAIAAFDLLSGEIHPSARTAAVEDSRLPRNAVLNRLNDGQSSGAAVWGQAYGGWGRSDGDGNAARLDRDSRGLVFGVDTRLGDTITLGLAASWTNTDLELADRASDGSVESVHGLAYLGAHVGAWTLKAGGGYAETSTTTERSVVFPGVSAERTASYDGSITQAFVEAGYRVPSAWGGHVEPFANLTMVQVKSDAFAETTGLAALAGEAINEDATLTTLGLRFETDRAGFFTLRGVAGWRHSTGDLDPVGRHALERHNTVVVDPDPEGPLGIGAPSAADAGPLALRAFDGGSTFTVLGAAQSEDAAFVNVEARWSLTPNVSVGLGYDGVLGSDGQDHAVTGGLKVVF